MESNQTEQAKEILRFLCDDLGGDWLLIGGTLVRLYFDSIRGTEDIDLVRIRHPELSDDASRERLLMSCVLGSIRSETRSRVDSGVRVGALRAPKMS